MMLPHPQVCFSNGEKSCNRLYEDLVREMAQQTKTLATKSTKPEFHPSDLYCETENQILPVNLYTGALASTYVYMCACNTHTHTQT